MVVDKIQVVHAYRTLYRSALRAVQYSSPARHIMKCTLKRSFRDGKPSDFDPKKFRNTILFLENAANVKGLEHRILKNLVHVRWWERSQRRFWETKNHSGEAALLEKAAFRQYQLALEMLNENLDLCLK